MRHEAARRDARGLVQKSSFRGICLEGSKLELGSDSIWSGPGKILLGRVLGGVFGRVLGKILGSLDEVLGGVLGKVFCRVPCRA